jgi:hypothetical protein
MVRPLSAADDLPPNVLCGTHGKQTPAVVCAHLLEETDRVLGFVENSSDPENLQAWCDDCERMFLREGSMTPAFLRFNDMQVLCVFCYERVREKHARDV